MNTDTLTTQQKVVYYLLMLGNTNKEIGDAMGLTEKTIKAYVTVILKTFGCASRTKLIVRHYTE